MAGLQELDIRQIHEMISQAADRQLPATVTQHVGEAWINLQSRVLDVREERIWIQIPTESDGTPYELAPADRVGVTFKLRHHKYVFVATVAGLEYCPLTDGSRIPVVSLCWPTQMQPLQRRAFYRADVPESAVVRASVWLGGRNAEPSGTSSERPVFTGQVTNLSAGGFQFRTTDTAAARLDSGYLAGVRLVFGAGDQTIYADAQIRHVEAVKDEDLVLIGFQFVGLEQSAEGKQTLRFISLKVNEYQRYALKNMAPASN